MYCDGKDMNEPLRKMDEEITNFLDEPEKQKLPRRQSFTGMYSGKFQTEKYTSIMNSHVQLQLQQ